MALMRASMHAAIAAMALTASTHTAAQDVGIFNPDPRGTLHSPDALDVPTSPVVAPAAVPFDTMLIEVPLPRPRPPLRDIARENPVALISAFRQQHGEGPVAISPALTRIAQEQANAMAIRDSLDHDVLAPFSSRMSRSRFNRAAENIAYGHSDFASTLKQWTNSAGHRANLLLRGAKWIGVAHAQNGRRMYWAMVIAGEMKDHIQPVNSMAVRRAARNP
jgi:uncharacterized protein YkwD